MPRMKAYLALALLLIAASIVSGQDAPPPNARLVSFPASGGTLYGFLYVPEGKGPFPAVMWNHGSEKRPGGNRNWPRSTTRMDLCSFCRTAEDREDLPAFTSWTRYITEVPLQQSRRSRMPMKMW